MGQLERDLHKVARETGGHFLAMDLGCAGVCAVLFGVGALAGWIAHLTARQWGYAGGIAVGAGIGVGLIVWAVRGRPPEGR